jgi:Zn ribbon nucleic-acid-binding protein
MSPFPPSPPSEKKKDAASCKHPSVQIVAREDDLEFVQCIECGDVFESSEFEDMNIEETKLRNDS